MTYPAVPSERLKETPSQTGGPYIHIGTLPAFAGLTVRSQEKPHVLTGPTVKGEQIRIEGIIYDGAGIPVRDALIEIWQANADGLYNTPDFNGWGRAAAHGETGEWFFETIIPGPTPWRDRKRTQAPHVSFHIFARGINIHLHTRMYFPQFEAENALDPALTTIEQVHLRKTLVAHLKNSSKPTTYRFDIHLQGDQETVFFDI